MNKLLFTIAILFAYTGLFSQTWNMQTGAWISPLSKNIGVQKSFQVGDNVGNDTLNVRGTGLFEDNVGIGTIAPPFKLTVLADDFLLAIDSGFFLYSDSNSTGGGIVWTPVSGSHNHKKYGHITGINYNIEDSTDLGCEVGIRESGGAHMAQIEFHGNTATGVGHVHIDVSDTNLAEIQFHIATQDSVIELSTNGLGFRLPMFAGSAQKLVTANATGTLDTASVADYYSSGTYTPTITNRFGLTSTTPGTFTYLRSNDIVTISGSILFVDSSSSTVTWVMKISLPIASDFTQLDDAVGSAAIAQSSSPYVTTLNPATLFAQPSTDLIYCTGTTNNNVNNYVNVTCTYKIK